MSEILLQKKIIVLRQSTSRPGFSLESINQTQLTILLSYKSRYNYNIFSTSICNFFLCFYIANSFDIFLLFQRTLLDIKCLILEQRKKSLYKKKQSTKLKILSQVVKIDLIILERHIQKHDKQLSNSNHKTLMKPLTIACVSVHVPHTPHYISQNCINQL